MFRRGLRAAAVAALAFVSACVEEPKSVLAPATAGVVAAPSVGGTYDCGEEGRIQVEFLGEEVRVTEADGSVVELPASPPRPAQPIRRGRLGDRHRGARGALHARPPRTLDMRALKRVAALRCT